MNIYDWDYGVIEDKYEFMGRSIIFFSDILKDDRNGISFNDEIKYPVWYPIKRRMDDVYDPSNGIQPAILCSF